MRQFDHLHAIHADASADPRLHGIARGLGMLFAPSQFDDLPEELDDLVARLQAQDDWDGPDRDGEA